MPRLFREARIPAMKVRSYHLNYAALIAAPVLIRLEVGGLVDPRIMVGMRKDVPKVTPAIRRASYARGFGGIAIGLFLIWWPGFRQP